MKDKIDLGSFVVRTGKDGKRGIYLRAYNVRMATFNDGAEQLADHLEFLCDFYDRANRAKPPPRGQPGPL
jgi:hypothetical protein